MLLIQKISLNLYIDAKRFTYLIYLATEFDKVFR